MRWRYGIIKNTTVRTNRECTNYYIGEIYYGDNPNKPSMCSDEGYFPVFEEDDKDPKRIKEEIKKVLNNTPNTSTNESLLKIRNASFPNKNPGVVDTRLIDKLLSQIGPYLGYSDWKEKIQ
jgi:hypothetical protein